jgi:transposase
MILTGGIVAKGFSLEVKRKVVDDYKSNKYTIAQIMSKHGVSEAAIYKWVKEDNAGVLAEPKKTRALREVKITKPQIIEIVDNYSHKNIGTTKLAVMYNVTPSSIIHILKREGVYEGKDGADVRRRKVTSKDIAEIINLYTTTDMNVKEIADKYSVTYNHIRQLLKDSNIEKVSKRRNIDDTASKYVLRDQVIADYKTGEHTHKTIADKYGVSTRTISRILEDAGIEALGGKKLASATKVADKMSSVVALADEGKGVFDIAEETGLSAVTVKHLFGQDKIAKAKAQDTFTATIVELHSQGLITKEIAEKAETSVYHVKRILEKLHLEPNSPSDKRRGAVIAFCKQGMSVDMIAQKTELSAPTVRKMLQEEGLSVSKGNEEVKAKVLELHQQGLKAPQIASECGISAPTVRKIIATSGQVKNLNERIVELYDGGMEIEQIAQEVGLNRPLVMIELSKAMKAGTLYRPFFPESDISVIKHLASKWTTPDKIASHLGCDENYIRRFLQLPDKKI